MHLATEKLQLLFKVKAPNEQLKKQVCIERKLLALQLLFTLLPMFLNIFLPMDHFPFIF